jgi:hypothetical protein
LPQSNNRVSRAIAIVSFRLKHIDVERETIHQTHAKSGRRTRKPSPLFSSRSATISMTSLSTVSYTPERKMASVPTIHFFQRPRSRTAANSNFAVPRPHLETSLHDLEHVFSLRLLLEVPATYRAT